MAPPPGFAEVTAFTSVTGDPDFFATVFGIEIDAPLTQGKVDDLSEELALFFTNATYGGAAAQYFQAACRFEGVHVLEGNDGPPFAWDSTSGNAAGSGTQPLAPQNVSFLAKKATAFAGKAFRGRMYLPCVVEGIVDNNGIVGASTITAMNLRLTNLLSNLASALAFPAPMVLLHSNPLIDPTTVTSLTMDTMVATQRRRLRR